MKTILKCIGYTFYFIYKSFLFIKNLIFNLLFIILCIIFINLFPFSFLNNQSNKFIKQNAILELTIDGDLNSLKENYNNQCYSNFFFNTNFYNSEINNSIFSITNKIDQAISDQNIKAILLNLKNFNNGNQPNLEYLGKYLQKFKNSGKKIFAIGEQYSQNQYYLASFANYIYIHKNGSINFEGFSNEKLYFKDFLDFINVKIYVFKAGKYKSAVEPFIRNNTSEFVRLREQMCLNYLWANFLKKICENRKIFFPLNNTSSNNQTENSKKTIEETGEFLKNNKLVDFSQNDCEIFTDINKKLINQYGCKKFYFLNIKNYNLINKNNQNIQSNLKIDKIAIIINNGMISHSTDTIHNIDSENTIKKIKIAENDPNVKALVFYVNSAGGSLDASIAIQQELENFKNSGKFLITVMGDIAASGGYWISLPSNYIYANKNTITGSIGIFTILYSIENIMNSIGIYHDGIYTEPVHTIRIDKNLTPEMEKILKESIQNGYNKFLNLASKYRKKSLKEIEKIANGKIWTGTEAKNNGLIDAIGDLDDGIKKAAELSKLKKYDLLWISNVENNYSDILLIKSMKNIFLNVFEKNIIENFCPYQIKKICFEIYQQYNNISKLNDPKNLYVIAFY